MPSALSLLNKMHPLPQKVNVIFLYGESFNLENVPNPARFCVILFGIRSDFALDPVRRDALYS